jgi:hypothetical protein
MMTTSQRRQLLRMLFSGEEPKVSSCPKADREALEKLGLLEVQRRGRSNHLVLTDAAWELAPEVIAAETAGAGALKQRDLAQLLLSSVHAYLTSNHVALADFVRPGRPAERSVAEQIRATYLDRTGGRFGQRLRLADLRQALSAVPPPELERGVYVLLGQGAAHLLSLDDPLDRQPRDDAAAISVGGRPRHLLYLERS